MLHGVPVIAFARGGTAETIRGLEHHAPTGVHFERQDAGSIAEAIRLFESATDRIDPAACRVNAERFATTRFREEFGALVQNAWSGVERARTLQP